MLQPWFVLEFILSILSALRVFFRSRCDTALEVLALRQQVAVLKRKRPRPTLNSLDRLFLDVTLPLLVPLGRRSRPRQARNRRRLAPRGFPALLALAIPPAGQSPEDRRRGSRLDPTSGGRECKLGSAQDPRRTSETRFCRLGADRRPVPGTSSAAWRPRQKLVELSPESPRKD